MTKTLIEEEGDYMYQLKLATTEKEILEFEKMRTQVYAQKEINGLDQASYADGITSGDLLAFQCLQDKELVGGMLVQLNGKNLGLTRLFVKPSARKKGAGSFMIDYLVKHREFFEDYYGTDIRGILAEPLQSSVDYYFDKGFDYSGFQMYKPYQKRKKGRPY